MTQSNFLYKEHFGYEPPIEYQDYLVDESDYNYDNPSVAMLGSVDWGGLIGNVISGGAKITDIISGGPKQRARAAAKQADAMKAQASADIQSAQIMSDTAIKLMYGAGAIAAIFAITSLVKG
jgi:hypothetical protein